MHAVALVFVLSLTHGSIPPASGSQPHLVTHHHRRHYRRIVYYSPIKGSHESLVRQNLRVQQDDLVRIQDDAQLEELTRNGELVGLPETAQVGIDPTLPENRRFCRPWTRSFVEDMAQHFYTAFRQQIQINSAVRTVEFQEHLRRRNHNAAAEDGEAASPHLTGATVDIAKHNMTRKQLSWARDYLLKLQNSGLLDVEEEFRQRVFHITVYRDYVASTGEMAGNPVVNNQ